MENAPSRSPQNLRAIWMTRPARLDLHPVAALSISLLLTACAAQQSGEGVMAEAPGFPLGVWHGFIFPVAWVISLFVDEVAIYAVPNNGGWYDFGYFIGIIFLGVGARNAKR